MIRFLCFSRIARFRNGVIRIDGGMENFSNPHVILMIGIELFPMSNSLEKTKHGGSLSGLKDTATIERTSISASVNPRRS